MRQSELLFGSLSWSPWYEGCPVHWLASTTNFTCVAFAAASQLRRIMSGATGRGLTDGNAFAEDRNCFQPAAIVPSHVGFAASVPAAQV